jgi:hypothetical protein
MPECCHQEAALYNHTMVAMATTTQWCTLIKKQQKDSKLRNVDYYSIQVAYVRMFYFWREK